MQVCHWRKFRNVFVKVRKQYQLIMHIFLLKLHYAHHLHIFFIGFLCLRAIDIKTRAPRPISSILHRNTTVKVGKENKNVPVNE